MTDSCLVMGGVWLGGMFAVSASSVCLLSTVLQGDQYWASLLLVP